MTFLLLLLSTQAPWVYIINIAFSALAVFHLAYLGSLFNSSVDYMDDDEEVTIYWMLFSYKMAKRSYVTLIMQCHVASSDLSEQSVVVDFVYFKPMSVFSLYRVAWPTTPFRSGRSWAGPATGWRLAAGCSIASSSKCGSVRERAGDRDVERNEPPLCTVYKLFYSRPTCSAQDTA